MTAQVVVLKVMRHTLGKTTTDFSLASGMVYLYKERTGIGIRGTEI